MDELLAPIGQLGVAMSNMEVDDAAAEAALAEVLAGAADKSKAADEEAARRAALAARSEARGKAMEANRHAQIASKLDAQTLETDGAGRRAVLKYYERAVFGFAEALEGEAVPPGDARRRTVQAMAYYVDRMRDVRATLARPSVDDDACDGNMRRRALVAMARADYPLLPRAVASRSAAEAAADDWPKFVLTADAADAFVAYLKILETKGQAPPPAVLKATTDLMADLERLAKALRANAPPPPPG